MPIKNYTTSIAEEKTVGEITGLLASKGARQVQINYDEQGRPQAICFVLLLAGFPVQFKLPCNFEGVFRSLAREYKDRGARQRFERSQESMYQSRRVAWRIIKDWVAAQLALVEAEQAQMAEVFLPYAVHESGQTMFQRFVENHCKALPAHEEAI